MLQGADLEAAVAQGIVTAEQAAAVRALAEQRTREKAVALGWLSPGLANRLPPPVQAAA
jgi:hypothetical protein